MISSDLKAAVRNIFRNKVPSAISILGLGIGLGCIIILVALNIHERSFDKFIPGHRNVYRVLFGNVSNMPYPLVESMSGEFPEVRDFFRYYHASPVQIKAQGNMFREAGFGFADPSIFRITDVKFVSGSPAGSLNEIAISDEAALKYFGEISPVGSVLQVRFHDGFKDLTVSGVYKSFPSNSTLHPSIVADIKLSEMMLGQFKKSLGDFGTGIQQTLDWQAREFQSYVVLAENSDPAALALKMEKYKEFSVNPKKDQLQYRLQPVAEIYLGSYGITASLWMRRGNPGELVYYEIIAILILIISIANYILLTRAGVSERLPDLGTRKAFGASGGKIRRLIILESGILVLFSIVPASFVIDYGMDFVNSTLNKTLSSSVFLDPSLWLLIVAVIVLTGILSGWLIGLYYSRIPSLELISGRKKRTQRSGRFNYSFLLLHFTIYMVLVSGVIAFTKQLRYSMTGLQGIDPENIIVADLTSGNLRSSFSTICDEIGRVPGVTRTAGGSFIPPFENFLPVTLATAEGGKVRLDGLIMGEGMSDLLGMELIDGEPFGPYKPGTVEVIINESSAKEHKVSAGEQLLGFRVKGIVKDFNAHSLHTPIQSVVILQQNPAMMGLVAIKTDGTNDEEVRKRIRELFAEISPDEIPEIKYLTDTVENFYSREKNQARIIGVFALLAAILSIMGLFGISMISILKRRKEIGLRKVNGASIMEVLLMVNTDFLKWVLISALVSVPLSIFLLNKWLERFAYKTELNWWIFGLAGLSAIIIAILTVSWQSIRAATSNPVDAIRYE